MCVIKLFNLLLDNAACASSRGRDPCFKRYINKHCEVLVSCSNWIYWIDLIELHACDKLSKAVISTARQL